MATTNTKLEDIILRAVDIVASQKIAKAGYDKTIQATVVSCIDQTIGKYKVKYQDSYWIAYSDNTDNFYAPNSNVYVLIPGGDFSKDKTILGTTKKLGSNYITITEQDNKYSTIGTNIVNNQTTYNLCSYKTETKVLYSVNFEDEQNVLKIDNVAVKEYIQNSTSIIAGAHIKNNLKNQQRFQGNYGILFGLDFFDKTTHKVVTRYYSIDVDTMKGNPYYYPNEIRQYNVFEIDGLNFDKVNMIAIFTEDFPIQDETKPDDIFISNIELTGAISLEKEDLDSYALILLTPKGYIFTKDSANEDTRTLQAQIRIKGRIADIKSQKIDFYWFVENLSVTAANPKYNRYGGQGWECLNNYRTISDSSEGPTIIQFIPGNNILIIKKSKILAEVTKYKCVAVLPDNTRISKEAKIIRYDSDYIIQVISSQGTEFYNDFGVTNLTCICSQKDNEDNPVAININDLKFAWGIIDNNGHFTSLPDTLEYNNNRQALIAVRDSIEKYIEAEYILNEANYDVNVLLPDDNTVNEIINSTQKTKVIQAKQILLDAGLDTTEKISTLLNEYNVETLDLTYRLVLDGDVDHNNSIKNAIEIYNGIQRVSENKIIGVQAGSITNFATFKCSVFARTGNVFLGSGSITINNQLNENRYTLVINDGEQVFKYNTHGVSPCSSQNDNPQTIPALTFILYDNSGNAIESSNINSQDITWIVPNNNTLLKVNYTGGVVNSNLQTISYRNLRTFVYAIANNYNANYTRNNIELQVKYNGLVLSVRTNLSFLKQGQNSTNGTDFVCKIIPNVQSGDVPVNPTIYYDGSSTSLNWDVSNQPWFVAQLWHNGNKIFEGSKSANSNESKRVQIIKWEVLKNQYAYNQSDQTNLVVIAGTSNDSWNFGFNANSLSQVYNENTYLAWRPANILKVTLSYDNMTYYATLPVAVCRIFNNNYSFKFKDYSGFKQVVYDSSGQFPKYDSHAPFEILSYYKINNKLEDISLKTTSTYNLSYSWYYYGSVWYKENGGTWTEDSETTSNGDSSKKWLMKSNNIVTQEAQKNQKSVKPADKYNGECVNTAMVCKISLGNTVIAWIHIPVHMMRNRFANSAINGWDGNSVNLGGENGGMILAPQVGAGIKDSNNKFTGVFIGTAKDPQEDLSGNKNNTSNSSQGLFANSNEDVGLFGYNEGSRSIFLDAKTGKAVFGEKGQAQIILDPTEKVNGRATAKIYSGNYVQKTNNNAGSGFLIDLTTPEMKFGTGNFEVNSDGHLTAKGGGSIAGWEINDNAIFNKANGNINSNITGMNSNPIVDSTSSNGSEYREVQVPSQNDNNGYVTVGKSAAFWAGGSKFFVTHDGYLKTQQASIGSGSKPIFIGKSDNTNSAIFSGRKSSKEANQSGFYLGTDGIGIGTTATITYNNQNKTVSNFQVDTNGTFYARQGKIANWDIKTNSLQTGSGYNQNNSMYFGTSGLSIGQNFVVTNSGNLTAKNGDFSGKITASSGKIANWNIGTNEIKSSTDGTYNNTSGMYFGSNGLRLGANFKVSSGGDLSCINSTIRSTSGNYEIALGDGQVQFWTISSSTLARQNQIGNILTQTWGMPYTSGNVPMLSIIAYSENMKGINIIFERSANDRFGSFTIGDDSYANWNNNKHCRINGGLNVTNGLSTTEFTLNDVPLVGNTYTGGIHALNVPYFEVNSATYANYRAAIGGSLYVTGQVVDGSDERLKNIIEKDDFLDDFILSLEPIKYTWKKEEDIDQKIHYGLGAQTTLRKMQQYNINSNLVDYIKEHDKYGIAYTELAPMMLGTVQKNREKINQLEQRIAILENIIKDIKGDNNNES